MAWPDLRPPGTKGIKRNLQGDVMSVHGIFNYQSPFISRTLVRNGKLYTNRDLRGSDDKIYGADWTATEAIVRNARLEEPFTLDVQGFSLHKESTAMSYNEFFLEDAILKKYHAEVAEVMKRLTGATYVVPFDHNLRSVGLQGSQKEIKGGAKCQQPAGMVHNDYTLTGGPLRFDQLGQPPKKNDSIQKADPALSEAIVKAGRAGRWAIINLWRNIRDKPVQVYPLACCDARTTSPEDLCVFEIHYADRVGENYFAVSSPEHRWYYYPDMKKDEVLLLKQWDSEGSLSGGTRAPFTLHSAFDDPSSPADAEDRESMEVRCICVWEK